VIDKSCSCCSGETILRGAASVRNRTSTGKLHDSRTEDELRSRDLHGRRARIGQRTARNRRQSAGRRRAEIGAAQTGIVPVSEARKHHRRQNVGVPVHPQAQGDAPGCPGLHSWNPNNPDRGYCDPGFAYHGNINGCASDLGYGRWEPCDRGGGGGGGIGR